MIPAHPTIVSLTTHLIQLMNSPESSVIHKSAVFEMEAMVERYTASLPVLDSLPLLPSNSTKQTILLTGSTGALGSYILAKLLADTDVERVWAVNRHSKKLSIAERQRESFLSKGLDIQLLAHEGNKLVYVEADLTQNILGLDPEVYEKVRILAPHLRFAH